MRLGLDMGTNSIGWWLYDQGSNGKLIGTLACGVRIFSDGRDPKSKASLAVDRREARSHRRRRDRYLKRRARLMKNLAEAGLMPQNPEAAKLLESHDPYELRARGLDQKLELNELGRALFHLNQRRGFKSNRKADSNDPESGKISQGAERLDQAMMEMGARSYGEFLHKRRQSAATQNQIPQVRTRMTTIQKGNKDEQGYDYYPLRQHYLEEFEKLVAKQAEYYPEILTDEVIDDLRETIFFQRELRPPKVGRCLYLEEERLPKAHPLFQERRLYETVNSLRVIDEDQIERPLTYEERETLLLLLRGKKEHSFTSVRKTLKLPKSHRFNLETDARTKLLGDEVRAAMGDKKRFGNRWASFDHDQQWRILERLTNETESEKLEEFLVEFQLEDDQIRAILEARIPDGYGRLGHTATRKILDELIAEIIPYSEAVKRAGFNHSDFRTGEYLDKLPYYGELLQSHVIPGSFDASLHDPQKQAAEYWGRITNPTVHIALGQLRHLVNDIIKIYGKPDEIVVEMGRDLKNSEEQKLEINKKIAANTKAAIARGEKIEELMGEKANTGANRAIVRIWEQLGTADHRVCPYCLKPIGIRQALSSETDIDHILPYSRTLDDSISNKVICHQECNRVKGNKTPYETWSNDPIWPQILSNTKNLPKAMAWRFGADAMEKFEGERNFEARQLTDMQYVARVTRQYLSYLYPDKGEGSSHVWSVSGALTEMLRRKWGLNDILGDDEHYDTMKKKNRQDHRHHAIDAAVVAATDRALVKAIAEDSKNERPQEGDKARVIEPPYDEFRKDIIRNARQIIASHRADHGTVRAHDPQITAAQLHNDTAYGITDEVNDRGVPIVVTRKPLLSLSEKDIPKIRDKDLAAELFNVIRGLSGKELVAALQRFSETSETYPGIRRVRLQEPLKTINIKDKLGKSYKGYKGDSNHCVEVWEMPDGKWTAELLTTFDAHQNGLGSTRPHPAAKLKMRLFKLDPVALDHEKADAPVYVIAKFSTNGLALYEPNQANIDARTRSKDDPIKYLFVGLGTFKEYNLRKVGVDRLGRFKDPNKEKLTT